MMANAGRGTGCEDTVMDDPGANTMSTSELLARLAVAEGERDRLRADFERFISAISHDIRGPLQVQKGLISLMLSQASGQADKRSRRFLDLIDQSADRLDAMVSALVEWSRVSAAKSALQPVDVAALRVALEFDLRDRLQAAGTQLSWGDVPQRLFGDARQLRRALFLLVDNALTHHGPGEPKVQLTMEPAGEGWRLTVTDDGPGLPAEMFERVLEPFVRLNHEIESRAAGMGLTICRRIVQRHCGEMSLASTPGQGAAFSFTLPSGSTST
jgi:signal transduction histidine kinase